jgi:hypothetical protein
MGTSNDSLFAATSKWTEWTTWIDEEPIREELFSVSDWNNMPQR